ncbi:hypothetical protein CWATWH8502_862 [Crocosphaera watsonii WH 8502]|uniref:Uncharacterized protein n=4 Tax=Crocosphaera watsonii TaxID=263511 RepID=T2JU09_CROWT|nr:hypothetical protein CWATWH8502_862 [Crocosphaera watsonii WH 8502]CCQ55445.1 hypothetical protein CWATWH0005_3670 [Crocosphaera watsonii WH 0005]CCQ63110.1 hypothetical protein CWATWH0401_4610 [Crocosphaera watsonii WH 0401]CCQ68564.1 hypothetical protein CWATWH0402_1365 [Crocosphaera watsonii WH 0402]
MTKLFSSHLFIPNKDLYKSFNWKFNSELNIKFLSWEGLGVSLKILKSLPLKSS